MIKKGLHSEEDVDQILANEKLVEQNPPMDYSSILVNIAPLIELSTTKALLENTSTIDPKSDLIAPTLTHTFQ